RLPAPRATDEEALAARGEGEQREEDEAGVALRGREGEAALAVAQGERLRRAVVELHVVVGGDDGRVDDPEVGLAQLLVQRRPGGRGVGRRGERAAVEVRHVERAGRGGRV